MNFALPSDCQVIEFGDTDYSDTFWGEFALCFATEYKKFMLVNSARKVKRYFSSDFEIYLEEFENYASMHNFWS